MPDSTLITVAPTGAETAKSDAPGLPVTLDELVDTARRCRAAGAAMIHVHVRDRNAEPTLDPAILADTVQALRENTDLVIQLSTGGAVTDPYERRLAVIDALPDSCSLTMGTVNFGGDVFMNPQGFIEELYAKTKELQVVPEFELFDLGHVHNLQRLLDRHGLPYGEKVHCDLVLNVPGGARGDVATLLDLVRALPDQVTSWSATGIGRSTLSVAYAALAAGGHLRVGMEDTLTLAKGVPVERNDQLVARAAGWADAIQRPAMTPDAARELLSIRPN